MKSVFLSKTFVYGFFILAFILSISGQPGVIVDAQSPGSLELTGSLGGQIAAVALKDNLAFLAEGLNLVILDVTDPSNPVTVGRSKTLPHPLTGIVVVDDLAYVTTVNGFWIFEIADSSNPTQLGSLIYPYFMNNLDVVNGRAYLAAGCAGGLIVVDVSDPQNPTELGSIESGDCANDVVVDDNYAYVADQSTGLSILDVSDPTNIQIVSQLPTDWASNALALRQAGQNTYLYIAEGQYFKVVDVTEPIQPAVTYQVALGNAAHVALEGNYAYVGGDHLYIYEISQPAAPVQAGTYNTGATSIALTPTTIFLAAWRLHILDRTDPVNLQPLSFYSNLINSWDIALEDNLGYIADGYSGLRIVNLTQPDAPWLTGASYSDYTDYSWISEITVFGNFAYSPGPIKFHVYDVTNPTTPVELESALTVGMHLEVAGDVLVYSVGDGTNNTLRVLDLTDPSSPTEIRRLTLPAGVINEVETFGSLVYLSTPNELLYVDLADPYQNDMTSIYQATANLLDFAVAYPCIYMVDENGVFSVLDVANPGSGSVIGSLDGIGANRIAFSGNYVYLVRIYEDTVYALDLADPHTPTLITSIGLPYDLSSISAAGKWIYLTNLTKGLFVLNLKDGNQSPQAVAGGPYAAFAGESFTLDASASSDPDQDTLLYEWDLDQDGEYDDASGVTSTTSFTRAGTFTIGLRVTDDGGLSDIDTASATIHPWTLRGFYQPVDMNGVYNVAKNGRTIPLKFEIFVDSTELTDITAVQNLTYGETACNANAVTDEIELTATGGTSLRYDSTEGQFIYNWKTPTTPGKCYRVTMTSMDGSSLVAFFSLK